MELDIFAFRALPSKKNTLFSKKGLHEKPLKNGNLFARIEGKNFSAGGLYERKELSAIVCEDQKSSSRSPELSL